VFFTARRVGSGSGENDRVAAAGERFWIDDLDNDEKAVLEHGQGSVDHAPDVLVVGGGILGVATALALHSGAVGCSVQLIEASRLASGATGGSAGLLQPGPHHGSDPACLVDLAGRSLERWRHLETTIPGGIGLVDVDWIGLAPHPEEFLADPPPTARWLEEDDVARLIPGLAHPVTAALIERQARLNPQRAVARLAQQLPHVATGIAATAVTIAARRITAVSTTAGTFQPGAVVFATGVPPDIDGFNLAVPTDLIKGHLMVTETTDIHLPGSVAPIAVPIEDGRLLVGGTLDVDDPSPGVRQEVIDALRASLSAALPAATNVAISRRWCCWRPHHPDGLPIIDRLPGVDNAWVTSGHYRTGVLMAPATADLLVEWISTGQPPPTAAPFSVSRFAAKPR
jgi:glycine oxidase